MLFEILCYTVAILAALYIAGDARHTSTATAPTEAPQPIAQPEPQPEPAKISDPLPAAPAIAATIAAPAAVAVVKVEVEVEAKAEPSTDYSTLKTPELRKECSKRGITWRNALGANKHLSKAAMIAALTC